MIHRLHPTPPKSLSKTQYWFAQIISQPLQKDSFLPKYSPTGQLISKEAAQYIVPSKLKPHERIQIYYQQYWWRLLSTLHEAFPLLVRMFGYTSFNETLAVPYLTKYPPNHWSLNVLGAKLPQWIDEDYHEPDRKLVYDVALLDEAFTSAFVAPHHPPVDAKKIVHEGGTDSLLSLKMYLQPHVHIFSWDYDLFAFRKAFLEKDVDHWIENDFPELIKDKAYSFVFHRGLNYDLYWRDIRPAQVLLIKLFQNGTTIEKACAALENESEEIMNEAAENLQHWFHEWTTYGWLTQER